MKQYFAQVVYYIFAFLTAITLIVGFDVLTKTSSDSTSVMIMFILTSQAFYVTGWVIKYFMEGEETFSLKLNKLKWDVLRKWGILFRTLFIFFLGTAAYLWLDPQPIKDIPFSELTLNSVFKNLFTYFLILCCILWFFKFPSQKNLKDTDVNPYVSWGWFGLYFSVIIFVISAFIMMVK